MFINHNSMNHQRGFNLIEVMVALVIFSVGLLGLSSMQQVGLVQTDISMKRTIAMSQAYDMYDRMRNNKFADYATAVAASTPNCVTEACTSNTEFASYDVFEWNLALASELPNGVGFITGDPTGYTVSVGWDESRQGSTPTSCSPPSPANVKCISVEGRP